MNNYGQQIPHLDLALEQWRAGTAPVAPYQPDPGMMTPPANPWAEAYASNVPPGSAPNPTASDATSGGGGASASVPMGPETGGSSPSGGFATPPEAVSGAHEPNLPEQGYKPIGGAYAQMPQLQGVNERIREQREIEAEEGTPEDRKKAATQAALARLEEGRQDHRPAFTQRKDEGKDFASNDSRLYALLAPGPVGHMGVDPRFKQAYDQTVDADERYGTAGAKIASIEGERARLQSEALGQFGEDVGKLHEKYVGDRTKIEGSQETALEDWKKGQEELGAMKIDPNRLFHDGGVPMAITTALGGILGGILGAMDGSNTNQFMNNLDKMINRDVAAQSAAIGKKRADQTDRMNLVGYWRGRLGDTYAAEQAAKASIYDQLKVRTDQLASQSQWGQAKFVGDQINAQTDLRKAAALQGLASITQNVAAQNLSADAAVGAARATALGKAAEKAEEKRPTEEQVRENNAETVETLDKNVRVFVPKEMRKDVGNLVAATKTFEALATQVIAKWPTYTAAQRGAWLKRLAAKAKDVEKLGAWDAGVAAVFEERMGQPRMDITAAITKHFGALNSQEAIADEVVALREAAKQAVRGAATAYARAEKIKDRSGNWTYMYRAVPFDEAEPDYAGEPRTAIPPTVDNIPQR
jgi:hypothetical protein